jgi:hypothetical protein
LAMVVTARFSERGLFSGGCGGCCCCCGGKEACALVWSLDPLLLFSFRSRSFLSFLSFLCLLGVLCSCCCCTTACRGGGGLRALQSCESVSTGKATGSGPPIPPGSRLVRSSSPVDIRPGKPASTSSSGGCVQSSGNRNKPSRV